MPLLASTFVAVSPAARLAIAYADTRAADLSFALDLPVQPALRTLEREIAGVTVDLRILGYSHQVVIADGGPAPLLTETVARLSGPVHRMAASALPEFHESRREAEPTGVLRYSMSTTISPLDDDPAGIEALMLELDAAQSAVIGVFPGHPHAFTGLRAVEAAPQGVEWRSWHAYPGTGELVQTHSRLVGERA